VPRATITDALGQTHTRYEHFYKGIRVWDSEGILHTPAKGAKPWWEGESREPGWELEIGSLMPLAKVQQKVREAQGPDGSRLVFGRSELVIFPVMATQVRGSAGAKANACDQVEYVADHVLAYC
jgi:hypothetical protein